MPPSQTAEMLMSTSLVEIRPDEQLDIAAALMGSYRIRHLPVVDHGQLLGLVSLRDLYAADMPPTATQSERTQQLHNFHAIDVMSRPVLTIRPDTTQWMAAELLIDRRISCLPVVSDDKMVGIVTATDLLRAALPLLEAEPQPLAVTTIMTPRPIVTVTVDDALDVAHALMQANRVRHLPVVDGAKVVGMVSDHDLLRAELSVLTPDAPDKRLLAQARVRVRSLMADPASTVDRATPALDAAQRLLRRRFGALPVLSAGKLAGIVTVTDFLLYLASYATKK